MLRVNSKVWLLCFLFQVSLHEVNAQVQKSQGLVAKFLQMKDTTNWKLAASIPLTFLTHHPQGMVKIGDYYFLSSVEVINRKDRRGVGHLFKFDQNGNLLADVILGEGAIYHPGGMDYDGENIWVPVAEYRPNSYSIVYKVNPFTLSVTEVFRFEDHLGGIVHNTQSNTLHSISWGSRKYYDWILNEKGSVIMNHSKIKSQAIINPSFYIDYQDCHYVGNNMALCSGLKNYKQDSSFVKLGGIELINLTSHQPVFQLPVQLWSFSGRPMTQNPFWMESTLRGLRAYFVPDDDHSTLYIYDIMIN